MVQWRQLRSEHLCDLKLKSVRVYVPQQLYKLLTVDVNCIYHSGIITFWAKEALRILEEINMQMYSVKILEPLSTKTRYVIKNICLSITFFILFINNCLQDYWFYSRRLRKNWHDMKIDSGSDKQ